MTQVPHSRPHRPAAVPVVPEAAPAPVEPPVGQPALPDGLHNALVLAIWQTGGVPIATAAAVAEQIGTNDKLLDALVAYRRAQQPPLSYAVGSVHSLNASGPFRSLRIVKTLEEAEDELDKLEERAVVDHQWSQGISYAIGEIHPLRRDDGEES